MIVKLISRQRGKKHLAGIMSMILPLLVWLCVFLAGVPPLFAEEKTDTPVEATVQVEGAKLAEEVKPEDQPLIINADNIVYSGVANEVIATGNVVVDNKGSKLSCAKMTVNTLTKDAQAEGDGKIKARLEDSQGVKEGTKIIYNFQTTSGTIIEAIRSKR